MPELPEVEHTRSCFEQWTRRKEITDAAALDSIVVMQKPAVFRDALIGRKVESVERFGKNVLVRLSGDHALWFHLGMTGRLVRSDAKNEALDPATSLPRFTRWWIEIGGKKLCLADGRRLGRALTGERSEVLRVSKLDRLGPDARSIASAEVLRGHLGDGRLPIKAALMDQGRIAGIGNIQAAEALWLAKIHPDVPANKLRADAWQRLFDAIHESLERAIAAMKGEQELTYVEAGGENPFRVYAREGEPCPRCGAKIRRETSAGRSTYLCPRCQRLRRMPS